MNTIGLADVSRCGPKRPAAEPPRISAAAPPAGSRARYPGKALVPLSTNADAITRPRPAQPSTPNRPIRLLSPAGSSASRPPRPSSQIRVVVTK